jgi:hypothetical protein
MKNSIIRNKWIEFVKKYKYYFRSNEEIWYNNLESVKEYIDTNKKRPSSTDNDISVKQLGPWLQNNITNYSLNVTKCKKIMKTQEIRLAWEAFIGNSKYSEYFLDNNTIWYKTLDKVKEYIDTNNKRPSSTDKDNSIKQLGLWLGTNTQNYNPDVSKCKYIMKTLEIRQAWKAFIGNSTYSEYFLDNTTIWYNNLEKVKEYIDTNNKRPNKTDKDISVKQLGNWLGTNIKNYNLDVSKCKHIMAIQEIRQSWKAFIGNNKYSEYFLDNTTIWYSNLESVKEYIDTNKKRPSSVDNDIRVKQSGLWLCTNTQNYNPDVTKCKNIMKTLEIRLAWEDFIGNSKYSEYFLDNNAIWYNNLEKVKEYIDTNNKRPSNYYNNISVKQLGTWLSNNITNYNPDVTKCKHIMATQEIRLAWKAFIGDSKYSEYFLDNNAIWYSNLDSVKTYIDNNNKRPSQTDKDNSVKQLGRWLCNNTRNYNLDVTKCKQIMKTPEIKLAWEQFLIQYSQYFPNQKELIDQLTQQSTNLEEKTPSTNLQKPPSKKSTTIKPKTISTKSEKPPTKRQLSSYQKLTQRMAIQNSKNTNTQFLENPDDWELYHKCRDHSFLGYDNQSEIPVNKIISYLDTKKSKRLKILDLGCGRNLIYNHFKNNANFSITGYDHISYNGSIACDISNLPVEATTIDICIFSQSLMGSNWKDYINEAIRVLRYNGEMIISESSERHGVILDYIKDLGLHIKQDDYNETNRWFYVWLVNDL